ncbi:MAG: hypothetical protein HDT47_09720 [Ruminococcaceae bacterium]|nr:hypothetical protein [Oscillospiraceae bacterium]
MIFYNGGVPPVPPPNLCNVYLRLFPHKAPAAPFANIAPILMLPNRRGEAANSLTGICPPTADAADGAEFSPKIRRLRRPTLCSPRHNSLI